MSEQGHRTLSKLRQKFRRRTIDTAASIRATKENSGDGEKAGEETRPAAPVHRRRSQKRTIDDDDIIQKSKVIGFLFFHFWHKIQFLTKILDFWPKFPLLTKVFQQH